MKKQPERADEESSRELFTDSDDWKSVRDKVLGLGQQPSKKSYYPELQRKLAELNRFKSLLDQAQDVILLLEKSSGKISDVNEYASLLLGYRKDELMGMVIDEIVSIDNILNERSITTMTKSDKSVVSVEINVQAVDFDNKSYVVVVGRDITERLRHERELQQYRTNLEVMVEERTRELSQTLQNLRTAQTQLIQSEKMASLGQLVAGVAHEINTPVGVGIMVSSAMVEITRDIISAFDNNKMKKKDLQGYFEKIREDSDIVLRNLLRTSDLIKSFKMVSVDQMTQDKREFNVGAYLNDVILSMKPKFKTRHKVEVDCPDNINIYSYPGAFGQVIINLLMNSILHAYDEESNGTINIGVSKYGDKMLLIYKDDGKGIPRENMNKIFNPFFTTNRHGGSTGLGLHIICNILYQTLNGTIDCESIEGQGTTFNITLTINQ
ncbi:MAG: PAS domain S-box protein [Nitrospirae bacterium]|nr:PAS domain S-box protein [Nitrospirota bacterium]MBF0591840.1 PAS domain S-box protein [Nitrospirota bacterium]